MIVANGHGEAIHGKVMYHEEPGASGGAGGSFVGGGDGIVRVCDWGSEVGLPVAEEAVGVAIDSYSVIFNVFWVVGDDGGAATVNVAVDGDVIIRDGAVVVDEVLDVGGVDGDVLVTSEIIGVGAVGETKNVYGRV